MQIWLTSINKAVILKVLLGLCKTKSGRNVKHNLDRNGVKSHMTEQVALFFLSYDGEGGTRPIFHRLGQI